MTSDITNLRWRNYRWFVVVLAVVTCLAARATAQDTASITPNVTVLLIPGLRSEDIKSASLPALQHLIAQSQSGWMVCRAARPTDPDQLRKDGRDPLPSLVLSIGTGSRGRVGPESEAIVSPTPHALHTRAYPPAEALKALIKTNQLLDHTVTIGALGDMVHRAGLRTYIAGNMDADLPDRSVYLFAMDHAGRADDAGARLSKILPEDTAPFGIRTNLDAILTDYDARSHSDAFRVIAIGDLHRADRYRALARPEVATAHRSAALALVNRAIEQFQVRVNAEHNSNLAVICPAPADSTTSSQDRLGLVVLFTATRERGILTSPSTRRAGLIDNSDILATFASWLHQPLPAGANGQAATHIAFPDNSDPVQYLTSQNSQTVAQSEMQNVFGGLPTVQLLLLLAALLAARTARFKMIARVAASAIVCMPLLMLVLPAFVPSNRTAGAIALVVGLILCASAAARIRSDSGASNLASTFLIALVSVCALDLITGGHLMHIAWMSYSATDGSRFYGIGNEYMGVLIGAFCAMYALYFQSSSNSRTDTNRLFIFGIAFTLGIGIMFFPLAGAKGGAIPSAGVALMVLIMLHPATSRKTRAIRGVTTVIALALIVGISMLADSHKGGSHLIRTAYGATGESRSAILRRKLGMEMRLLTHSPWMPTLVAGACGVWFLRRNRASGSWRRALTGSLLGGAACLVFNDAGVLAASNVFLVSAAASLLVPEPLARAGEPASENEAKSE